MIIKQTSKYKNNKPFCSGDVEPEHKFLITAPTSQHTGYFRLHRLRLPAPQQCLPNFLQPNLGSHGLTGDCKPDVKASSF